MDVQWAGKAGTLALMFALPGFLLADAISEIRVPMLVDRVFTIGGLVLSYYAAVALHPAGPGCAAGETGVARREDGGVKAVILAGGEGTRLRPLTSNQPKPMMPLANRPMMEHVVRLLAVHGFDDVVVTVAFLANQIRDYFGDGSDFGVRMRYATEETRSAPPAPSSTSGSSTTRSW